jgi:malyl-CoA/(S)-citramalyl-CoA lyase
MIHFFPQQPEDGRQAPRHRRTVDILLGNLEDAIPADNKEAARRAREGRQGHRLR